MAQIGQQLLQPESGWRRYDDTDSNISYAGDWVNTSNSIFYGGSYNTIAYSPALTNKTLICKFNFTGSKIRIISSITKWRSEKLLIKIDNLEERYGITSLNDTSNSSSKMIIYEKIGLIDKEHIVEIYMDSLTTIRPGDNSYKAAELDAIDIDENGELKPYTPSMSLITWNPNDKTGNYTLSNNNLTASLSTSPPFGYHGVRATKFNSTGKFYMEFQINDMPNVCTLGLATYDANLSGYTSITQFSNNIKTGDINAGKESVIGMAFDLDNHIINFYINGILDTNYTITLENEVYTVIMMNNNGENKGGTITANFGATPFNIVSSNKSTWDKLIYLGYKPYDVYNANWEWRASKYLIKQNSNYYSINNNYIDLGKIDNSEELNNIIDEYGYDDISILTKELNSKKIPTKLENDYYKSFDINLNDIKDNINLIEENDKKYIEYSCSNYKISDEIKDINNGKFEVLMKE
ncbi:cell adhesion protein [Clostridium sporogenes]|uniref:cell adhesion protein n=1 Tax=Clostridium sporogenes TaxID=1509 RepID=UPI0013CFDA1A|nr:cell adhesion protein [Clostridium sporogenes]NFP92600.1 cell adhesion protein [Clostridium sporogenes]